MKFNWVTLKVKDLDKSLYFYTKLLGLDIAAKLGNPNHQIVMLGESDKTMIELIYDPDSKDIITGNGVSIGLEISNADQLISTLKGDSYSISGPVSPNPQMRFFFVNDPDGYTIQLIEMQAK